MSAFEEVGLAPELIRAVEELGWLLPSPVQAEAVPLILGGGDVMAAAETGSGKTGAFALPVLQIVHESLRRKERGAAASSGNSGSKGSAAAGPPSCVMSTEDRDAVFAVAPDGLRCQARSEKSWGGGRGSVGAMKGKVYFEVTVTDEGLARVGVSTLAASLDLGTDRQGWGYGGTGKKSHQRQFDSYGQPYGLGDTIGVALDCDAGELWFSKNGQDLGVAFQLGKGIQGQVLYPAVCLKNAEVLVNFGATPFRSPPPHGYCGLASAPPQHLVAAGTEAAAAYAAGSKERSPLCIILEPSRDLAEQTHNCVTDFKKHLAAPELRNGLLVGGVDAGPQLRMLKEGCDVVVGTPGRIIDFIQSGKLAVDQVRFFVLDEADRLIDNLDTVMDIFKRLPKAGTGINRLQVLMFSATLHSPEVKDLASRICVDPTLVDLKGKDAVPEAVDHALVMCDPREDRSWLQSSPQVWTDNAHVLDRVGPNMSTPENWSEAVKRLKPRMLQRIIDTFKMDQCLIFCRTNFDCDNLEKFLNSLGGGNPDAKFRGKRESGKENPYSCVVLGGARSMEERRRSLQAFKAGDVRFLICTDVAARGIDIQGLPYVINMTLPDRSEDYIHRVGRVGRADTMGLAISIVSPVPEKVWYCTVKGLKPWLEPNAKNTGTQEQGGHTIWYQEPDLLKDIEQRLGRPIARLAEDLSLPPAIVEKLAHGGEAYGQQRGTGTSKEVAEHLEAIRQNVEQLEQLEREAQVSFLTLRRKFGAAAAKATAAKA